MDGVKLDLLVQHFNFQLKLVECLCNRLELPHGVVDKSPPFGAVVELQPSCSFIVTKVGWGPKPDYKIKLGLANYYYHHLYLTHRK